MKIVNLDEVLLTSEVVVAWNEFTKRMAFTLALMGRKFHLSQAPDEKARVEGNGTLTIFCEVPGIGEISLNVPPEHWSWRQ